MLIRCPACEHSRHINPDKIPPRAEFATCPKCGHRFRFRALALPSDSAESPSLNIPAEQRQMGVKQPPEQPKDIWEAMDSLHEQWKGEKNGEDGTGNDAPSQKADKPENSAAGHEEQSARNLGHVQDEASRPGRAAREPEVFIPWENPRELGLVASFYRTMLMVLLHPVRFFGALRNVPPLAPALVFAIAFGLLQKALEMVWWHLTITSEAGAQLTASLPPAALQRLDISRLPMIMLTSPFMTALHILILGGLIHMMLRLVQPEAAGFTKTCKVASYASAAYIFAVVPILGMILPAFCYIMLLAAGMRHAFGLAWSRVALVILPPYLLMFLLAAGQMTL